MTPDMDDFGLGLFQPLKRLFWFMSALAYGAVIGGLAEELPGLFRGDMNIRTGNVIKLMLDCILSSAMPVFLGLIILILIDWRLTWILSATVVVATATLLSHEGLLDILSGAFLLGMSAAAVWWIQKFRQNRWAAEVAILQAENAQRIAHREDDEKQLTND